MKDSKRVRRSRKERGRKRLNEVSKVREKKRQEGQLEKVEGEIDDRMRTSNRKSRGREKEENTVQE